MLSFDAKKLAMTAGAGSVGPILIESIERGENAF
jgi:hypothetical protein